MTCGTRLPVSAVPFIPARHGQTLPGFVEVIGRVDGRFGFVADLSAWGSRCADAWFETCPAWVAKLDEGSPNRAGAFSFRELPGSKLLPCL